MLADVDSHHVADQGDRVRLALRRQLGDGIAVLFIMKRDALNSSGEMVHGSKWALDATLKLRYTAIGVGRTITLDQWLPSW